MIIYSIGILFTAYFCGYQWADMKLESRIFKAVIFGSIWPIFWAIYYLLKKP